MSLVSVLQTAFTRVATEFKTVRTEIAAAAGPGTAISALPDIGAPVEINDQYVMSDASGGVTVKVSSGQVQSETIGLASAFRLSTSLH